MLFCLRPHLFYRQLWGYIKHSMEIFKLINLKKILVKMRKMDHLTSLPSLVRLAQWKLLIRNKKPVPQVCWPISRLSVDGFSILRLFWKGFWVLYKIYFIVLECQCFCFRLRGVVIVVVNNKKYFGLKRNTILSDYISASRERIFNFKTVLERILVPL